MKPVFLQSQGIKEIISHPICKPGNQNQTLGVVINISDSEMH